MSVPLLDVNAQNLPLEDEMTAAFQRVFRSGRFIMGPDILELERETGEMLGVGHCVAVSSGTDALLLALMALNIGPGDEVLCPAFTFFATAGAVHRVGATPVFVDVCPVCFNMDPHDAASKITPRTKALMPVHLFGQSADMDAILTLAHEHDLKVIEDAAQAIGAGYKGRACGTIGDFGAYSFFPSKNLGGLGDGGMLVTQDEALAARARSLRNHGMEPKYYHQAVGGNFRMDTLQAAFLRVKLPHYADYTRQRQENAADYTARLTQLTGVVEADPSHCRCIEYQNSWLDARMARLVLPVAYPHNAHIWNQYTIRVLGEGCRDALRDHLTSRQIGCEIYYPLTLDQQECFSQLPSSARQGCEVAHRMAREVLSIPIYGELTSEQRGEVVSAIAEFLVR